MKKTFFTPRNSDTYCQFFENLDLEWHSCSGEMSLFDKLILGVSLLRPVFLSDVLSDVIAVISKYSTYSVLSNCRSSSA